MKRFIVCLLLGTLLGMISPLLPAQQNQNVQKLEQKIEALEKQLLEMQKQLENVENIEKMDLQAKLAEANAKLIGADFGAFKNKVWVDNEERMRRWSHWFFGILGIIVVISGGAVWLLLKSLIADGVEKNLNGFKKAMSQLDILKNQQRTLEKESNIVEESFKETINRLDILKNQQRTLEKEHVVSMLEYAYQRSHVRDNIYYLLVHPGRLETVNEPREEVLLDIFGDAGYSLALRFWAAMVLADRKSPRLVSPTLECLNSVLDSDSYINPRLEHILCAYIKFLGQISTLEAYQGLTKFLNRLLTGDSRHKDLFLTWTTFVLADISIELNQKDSLPILRRTIPDLKNLLPSGGNYLSELTEYFDIFNLAKYFDKFNEPEGIKEILTQHVTDGMPDVENKYLELLQEHDPEFVNEWRARETTDNSDA